MRPRNSPGHVGVCRPNRSRICVLAISTPMPLVKPITTGRGMYLTAVPRPVTPSRIRITPAISVHMNRPSMPCAATMPETTTTKAPVGPPIWTRDPPSAEMMKPATIGAVDAVLRRHARGDRERHRERQRHQPDGDAGDEVAGERAGRVALAQAGDELRKRESPPARRAVRPPKPSSCLYIRIFEYYGRIVAQESAQAAPA